VDTKNKEIYTNKIKISINEYGDKAYINAKGQLHRLNSPAIEYPNGTKYWYILNKHLEVKVFNSWIFRIKFFLKNKRL